MSAPRVETAGSSPHRPPSDGIERLRDAYEVIQSVPLLFEYGPLRAYENGERIQELWRTRIDDAVALVADTERELGPGRYAVDAPSPWHAYFYLRAQQQWLYRGGGKRFGLPVDETVKGDHMFFRGQRCASWDFRSSAWRRDPSTRDRERLAAAALREYFANLFVGNADMADVTARCFAQHYGIATELADVTCDPDIAVWFATHPHGASCPSGERDAVVRAFTWASQVDRASTVFLLPPPFVRNVYAQRGLFIDTAATDGALDGDILLDVRFPRESGTGEFRVLRGAQPIEVWPSPDEDESALVAWARAIADAAPCEDAVSDLVREHRHAGKLPAFWLSRELYDFQRHVAGWISILDWVLPGTCVTAIPAPADSAGLLRYEVQTSKVRALVRSNPSFFDAFCHASEESNFTGFEVLKLVVDLAAAELAKGAPAAGNRSTPHRAGDSP